jgi:hypothetical protein
LNTEIKKQNKGQEERDQQENRETLAAAGPQGPECKNTDRRKGEEEEMGSRRRGGREGKQESQ